MKIEILATAKKVSLLRELKEGDVFIPSRVLPQDAVKQQEVHMRFYSIAVSWENLNLLTGQAHKLDPDFRVLKVKKYRIIN